MKYLKTFKLYESSQNDASDAELQNVVDILKKSLSTEDYLTICNYFDTLSDFDESSLKDEVESIIDHLSGGAHYQNYGPDPGNKSKRVINSEEDEDAEHYWNNHPYYK